ncbi:MAG: hypothetical protein M3Z37_02850 [Candidatus Eremiobacteraeota bacterium]|nr:hypothetical protein [Candidatus Eremiobacteraeota bacterium]
MKANLARRLRRPGVWMGAGALLFFGAVAYFLISALLTPDIHTSAGQSQLQMNHVVGQGEHGMQVGWRFQADRSEISPDGTVTTYHHVHGGTYYIDGKPAYKITAGSVTLDMRTQNYTGYDGVHIWSVRPHDISDLRTQTLSWNNPLQLLTCPGPVHVKYKGYAMTTAHLTANFLTGDSSLGPTSIHSNG